MDSLAHIVEPSALLLTWQPADEGAPKRTRRTVARIDASGAEGSVVFRYLKDDPDFKAAEEAGFIGFPAFPTDADVTSLGVVETLLRRLPPRKREDFERFLAQHRLPAPFTHSDLALLGYTGARLPSDGFGLVPEFPADAVPCDLIAEVAGLRHTFQGDASSIHAGDAVTFRLAQDNPVDSDAIEVLWQGQSIGYVNRALRATFGHWLRDHTVTASVERVNGKPTRPLVYIRVAVR